MAQELPSMISNLQEDILRERANNAQLRAEIDVLREEIREVKASIANEWPLKPLVA